MAFISNSIMMIIFGVLGVFLIIELGLTGYVVGRFNDLTDGYYSSSRANFMLFNSIWSILVLGYVAAATLFFSHAYDALVSLVLLGITALFWFAGSIALAVGIGGTDCGGSTFCQSAQAATAFGFFIWVIFTALAVIKGMMSRGAIVDGTRSSKPAGPASTV
jgi:hypothetical protein